MQFKKYISKFNPEEIIKLNNKGKTIREIAEVVDIPEKRLAEMIKFFNLDVKKGVCNKVNESFFDIIDSEEKAYLLGFFIADGCIQREAKKRNGEIYSYSYRFSINNSIDDEEVVSLFQQLICPHKKLEYKNNQKGVKIKRKQQVCIRWTSKHMYETLSLYNIHERKTYDSEFEFPFDKIPEDLVRHFIRGFFDGDGHKSKTEIEFILTSKKFGNQILKFFKNFNYRWYEIKGKTCIYYKLYITGGKKLMTWIYNQFYNNANCFLNRKYILFNTEVSSEITQGSETP